MRPARPRAMPTWKLVLALALASSACGRPLPLPEDDDDDDGPASPGSGMDSSPEREARRESDPVIAPPAPPGCGVVVAVDPTIPARPATRIVFVTSSAYAASTIASLAEADRICQKHAASGDASLAGRSFKAWLSALDASPATRFEARHGPAIPYVRLDSDPVALGFGDLVDEGTLHRAIALDEHGRVRTGNVWTGTLPNGSATTNDCNEWRSSMSNEVGTLGAITAAKGAWSAARLDAPCTTTARLYCFED